jgi:hypothetical protein
MVDSNRPYRRVQHDSVWNGAIIGAGAGIGMVGAAQGGMLGWSALKNRRIRNLDDGTLLAGSNGVMTKQAAMDANRQAYNRFFGGKYGWLKKGGAYLGAGALAAGIGALTDYMTD